LSQFRSHRLVFFKQPFDTVCMQSLFEPRFPDDEVKAALEAILSAVCPTIAKSLYMSKHMVKFCMDAQVLLLVHVGVSRMHVTMLRTMMLRRRLCCLCLFSSSPCSVSDQSLTNVVLVLPGYRAHVVDRCGWSPPRSSNNSCWALSRRTGEHRSQWHNGFCCPPMQSFVLAYNFSHVR
jgi:hypothetical protein